MDTPGYDQAHRLASASVAGAASSYAYDGDGTRASQPVGGVTTHYVSDVAGGLPVLLEDGSRKYVWGAGGLAYSVETASGALEVSHADGLGSVRASSDSVGGVVRSTFTDEFGVPLLRQGSGSQPFGYTGEQTDSTGLVYLRARMYDPQLGRFLQADPLRKSGPGVGGWNRYTYVGNNPVRFTDPSGLCADPGGPGIRYCLDRFIPWAVAGLPGVRVEGDNRWRDPYEGNYRIRHLVGGGMGHVEPNVNFTVAHYPTGRQDVPAWRGACGASAKSNVLGGRDIRIWCTAGTNAIPLIRMDPIHHSVLLREDAQGNASLLQVYGTPFPSLELWQYTDAGATLVYFLDAARYGTGGGHLGHPVDLLEWERVRAPIWAP